MEQLNSGNSRQGDSLSQFWKEVEAGFRGALSAARQPGNFQDNLLSKDLQNLAALAEFLPDGTIHPNKLAALVGDVTGKRLSTSILGHLKNIQTFLRKGII